MTNWYDKIALHYPDLEFEILTDQCIRIGRKVHLHRDIFETKPQLVISRLDSLFGHCLNSIFARATTVHEVKKSDAQKFLDQHHLLGFGGGKTFLGLRDETELVALAVFSKVLYMKYEDPPYYSAELERYCSLQNTTVTGGLDKLIKAYLKKEQVDDIITYVDKEWSDGGAYLNLGFNIVGETGPITFLVDPFDWSRRSIDKVSVQHLEKGQYVIQNQGNLKMRLKIET